MEIPYKEFRNIHSQLFSLEIFLLLLLLLLLFLFWKKEFFFKLFFLRKIQLLRGNSSQKLPEISLLFRNYLGRKLKKSFSSSSYIEIEEEILSSEISPAMQKKILEFLEEINFCIYSSQPLSKQNFLKISQSIKMIFFSRL